MADQEAGQGIAKEAALGAARGGAHGAVIGAGMALLKKGNRKWLYIALVVVLLPSALVGLVVFTLFGTSTAISSIEADQSAQAVTASGTSEGDYQVYSSLQDQYSVPWEVLAAIVYYESGPGFGDGEKQGSCPPGTTMWTESYCPATALGDGGPGTVCMPTSGRQISWAKPGRYSWTVPAGTGMVSLEVDGASGGDAQGTGGRGATVQGCAHVAPGEELTIYVGAPGSTPAEGGLGGTGYRPGGAGGQRGGAGGGGSSAVVLDASLLVEAGGGGGAGRTNGGAAGYPYGVDGASDHVAPGGEGGKQQRGQAGNGKDGGSSGPWHAGGGGAGWDGGGGGSAVAGKGPVYLSGGGGGSSWASSAFLGAVFGQQAEYGPGQVGLSYQAGLGPFGLTTAAGLSGAQADNLQTAGAFVAQDLERALSAQQSWEDDSSVGWLTDEVVGDDGIAINTSGWGAETTMSDFVAALSTLPIEGNSKALDENIYELAADWGVDQSPVGTGAIDATSGMVCAPPGGPSLTVAGPSGAATVITSEQLANAAVIVKVGQQMGLPDNALQIAIGTSLQESDLYDLPNANVPASLTDPYAQWGSYSPANPPHNGTSVGLFQQQVGIWDNGAATVAEAMSPTWSSQSFFTALEAVPGWQTAVTAAQMGEVAQEVQHSAFGPLYQYQMPAAATILGAALGIPCQGTGTAPSAIAATVIAAAEKWVGEAPYVWGGGGPSGPTGSAVAPPAYVGDPGFDCSGLVQYALAQAGVVVPHYSGAGGQFTVVQEDGGFTTDISQLQPGDLVFFVGVGDGGTQADPGHVGIYIGNDEMVDAPYTGALVSIDPVTPDAAGGFVGGGPAWPANAH